MAMVEQSKADFGTRMKRLREERGVSLRRIADATKISVSALEALERNDISRLPGGIFSRAFVRSYAIEVGLDPEKTVREFLVQFPHDSVTAGSPHAPLEDYAQDAATGSRTATVLALLAISILIGTLLFLTLSTN
jgi:cytoskeletal protein RodZ